MGTNSNENTIGKRVKYIRKNNHLSQYEFTEKLGISVNFLSEIENDKKNMSLETLKKICEIFTVSADYLLLGQAEEDPDKELIQLIVERGNECSIEQIDKIVSYFNHLKDIKKELQ